MQKTFQFNKNIHLEYWLNSYNTQSQKKSRISGAGFDKIFVNHPYSSFLNFHQLPGLFK